MQVSVVDTESEVRTHLKRKQSTPENEESCESQKVKKSDIGVAPAVNCDVYAGTSRQKTDTSHPLESLQQKLGQHILRNEPSEIHECLLSGARLDLPVDSKGVLPLCLSLLRPQNHAAIETLVSFDQSCVNLETKDSLAPLLVASMNHDSRITRFLLDWGADPFRPGADERPSTFDQLSYPEALPRHRQKILDILQEWRRSHPETFQTSLRLCDIRR